MNETQTQGGPELPPLYEAVLDADQLDALFADLAAQALPVEVVVRDRARQATAGPRAATTLPEARALLVPGAIRAVQLRYPWDGAVWWDTLTPVAAGFRLIRVRHDPTLFA
ncbi:MAG: hypothetical protein Q8L86_04500 [Vicinamibacterales bacterium]|nr:hypothetical protein [Vicinamibacterales bacterium]